MWSWLNGFCRHVMLHSYPLILGGHIQIQTGHLQLNCVHRYSKCLHQQIGPNIIQHQFLNMCKEKSVQILTTTRHIKYFIFKDKKDFNYLYNQQMAAEGHLLAHISLFQQLNFFFFFHTFCTYIVFNMFKISFVKVSCFFCTEVKSRNCLTDNTKLFSKLQIYFTQKASLCYFVILKGFTGQQITILQFQRCASFLVSCTK